MSIFERKGHAMQRPPHLTASQCFVRFPRPFPCPLGIYSDNGVQGRIVFIDLRQMRFQHFCGRNVACPDGGGQLRRTGENNVHHNYYNSSSGLWSQITRPGDVLVKGYLENL